MGITVGFYFGSYLLQLVSFYGAFALFFVSLLLVISFKAKVVYRNSYLIGICIYALLLSVGCYLTIYTGGRYKTDDFSKQTSKALIVKVGNEPKLTGSILRFETDVLEAVVGNKSIAVTGKLLVALKVDSLKPGSFNYGDVLLIPSHFTAVDPPFNPGEFDYRAFLANHQIYSQSFINQHETILLSKNKGNRLISYALKLRKELVRKYYKYLPDADAAAFASTLILGYRADLSPEIISAYSKTGTMHVLSVSGMHVGIVFLVLSALLKPLNRNKHLRILRVLIIIIVIWFYSLITGFSPSVCRAAVMLTFIVCGKAFSKTQNSYNLLAISAFLLLLYNPYYLVDVGFQLSYLAVAGLIYFHPKIYHLFHFPNYFVDKIWSYTALSLAAQLATFPLSIYYFHQFPVYFLLSNLFIVLPVAILMYAGILFLFIPWDVILKPFGQLLNGLIGFTNQILFYIEHLPWANWSKLWINLPQYLLLYIVIGCVVWALTNKSKTAFFAAVTSLLMFIVSVDIQKIINLDHKELVFYSLRKNSAIAYQNQGKSILITDLDLTDKTWSFSINPSLDQSGAVIQKVFPLSSSYNTNNFLQSGNFIQCGNFKILRWDKGFNRTLFSKFITVDVLLLSGNPKIELATLVKSVRFKTLLIDATNPDYKIKIWSDDAKLLGLEYRVLKKSPAYIVKL